MKLLAAIPVSLVIVGGGLWLAVALAMGTTSGGCAAALLQGTLVEQDGTLAVESVPPGRITKVTWPFGYGVGNENGTLTVTRLFSTVAREGDEISVGGGMAADNIAWAGCGQVTLGLMFPPEEIPSEPVRATLTVTGTAYEPCIPPPSGCGYWVTLTSERFGTDRAALEHNRTYESAARTDRWATRPSCPSPARSGSSCRSGQPP